MRKKINNNPPINSLYQKAASHIEHARQQVAKSIDTHMVKAYWLIGRDIVEEEQRGEKRANYGKQLLKTLSEKLTLQYKRGFSVDTLERARKFYLLYQNPISPKSAAALRKSKAISTINDNAQKAPSFMPNLSWIHYLLLIRIPREDARKFYEIEASNNHWSSRELKRQIGSLLFDRLSKSKDKNKVLKLASKGQEVLSPSDAIKDPFILEFLDLPESHKLVESKIESALIHNLQHFVLELGKGVRHEVALKSCFRASRKPSMSLDEPRDMNKELSQQCDEMLVIAEGNNRERSSRLVTITG